MPLPFPPLPRLALWLPLLLAPLAVGAQPRAQDVSVLAGTCFNCHGPGGHSPGGGIPSLRGQAATHLLQRMQAFKAGQAADATVMPRLMKGYDDAQLQALAQWFAAPEGQR